MKKMIRVLSTLIFGFSSVIHAQPEMFCPPVDCVPQCIQRSGIDGRCLRFGRDFCAPDAYCVPNCVVRSNIDGRCTGWGADYCSGAWVPGCGMKK